MSEPIWINNFQILFTNLADFFPTRSQTREQKINAIVRFSLYASILLSVYHSNIKFMSIFVFVLFLTFIIYKNYPQQAVSSAVVETLDAGSAGQVSSAGPITSNSLIGATSTSADCTKPTVDNPFMNFTMKDFMTFDANGNVVDRPPACEQDIKESVDAAFNNNLYRDISDVFGKVTSQRNYFTMPWTSIVNDQDKFANWLYNNPATCKENQDACIGQNYEDLRSNRFIFPNPDTGVVDTKK